MAAIDFPASPSNGQQFTGPGGVIWVYDSTKTAWVSGTLTTGIYAPITNDVGRNLIHNSMFNIAQRAGPFTAQNGIWTLDRWNLYTATDTFSITRAPLADADRTAIGDEAAQSALQNGSFVGNGAPAAFQILYQTIEGVRRLAGKTVILSFWAKASTGGMKLGAVLDQGLGTGGSPANVPGVGQSVTLTTAFARYSLTFAVPTLSGKTVGTTNNDDGTVMTFCYSSGTTNAAHYGSPGVQSGTISLWGVQLEVGTVATPLQKLDPAQDLAMCQRFFCTFAVNVPAAAAPDNLVLPTTMRAAPSVITGGGTGFAATNTSAAAVTISQTTAAVQTLTFSADL